jgi:hypothetical protein
MLRLKLQIAGPNILRNSPFLFRSEFHLVIIAFSQIVDLLGSCWNHKREDTIREWLIDFYVRGLPIGSDSVAQK